MALKFSLDRNSMKLIKLKFYNMKMKLLYIGLLMVCFTACCDSDQDIKPNIIFIMADDLGYSDLGCYGQELIKTPNIDRLAEEGMRFTQVYSGSAVCAPARSVLMTGLHTGHTRVRGNTGIGGVVGLAGVEGRIPLREEDITVAQLLQDAGYVTCMVGKWGLGDPNTSGVPNKKGFDEFYGFLNQRRAHTYFPDYIWHDTTRIELPGNKNGEWKEYTHELFADYALDFLERHKDEAFFLYLPFCIPHGNYEVPDQGSYSDMDWTEDEKAYAAMISRMDKNIGRIMEKLKDLKIDDNTYIFFTSDNGVSGTANAWLLFNSSSPLRGEKSDPYEGGIRAPMIVHHPGKIRAGQTSELVWYFADVMPTLAEIANVPIPGNIDGVSVLPTLLGGNQDRAQRYLYWEFYKKGGWRALRFGDWKAVQQGMNEEIPRAIELYNLKQDIGETTDLADEYPEIIKKVEELFKGAHTPTEEFVWGHSEE